MEDVEKLQMTLVIEEQNSIIKEQQELLADMQKELSKANEKLKQIDKLISNYPSVRIIEEKGMRFAVETQWADLIKLLKKVLEIIEGEDK